MESLDNSYISALNAEEIRNKIAFFSSLDLSVESDEKIMSAILDIFCVELSGKKHLQTCVYLLKLSENEHFYRVRKLNDFREEVCLADFWGNPSAPQNRFNRTGEKVLYVSKKIETALLEMHVAKNESFVLIQYSNMQPLELSPSEVRNKYGDENVDDESLSLLNEFINNLASSFVGTDERYKYNATCALADVINMFPEDLEEIRDGMLYISSHTGKMENVVIKGDHLNKLILNNAWVASIDDDGKLVLFGQFFIENDRIRYGNVSLKSIEYIGSIISIKRIGTY